MVNTEFPMVTIITKNILNNFFSSKKKRSSKRYARGGTPI